MSVAVQLPNLEHWKAQVKCQAGCPVATDAGRYVQLIAEGRLEDAFLVARSPNPFASVCGRVCAAPCEDACRRGAIDAPIAIRALKRYVTERYGVESVRPDTQDRLREELIGEGNRFAGHLPVTPGAASKPQGRKVAVVGAGPSGLAAAHDLALLGYQVTVFEAADEPGGMMRFGIPEYRLPRTLIRAEIDKIVSLGVTLKLGAPLTPSFGLAELRREGFLSVFLSTGVSKGRDLQLPGVELDGVVKAVDYLLNVNRGYRMSLGRRVVVIGGGFVAFDAARTALRAALETEAEEGQGGGPPQEAGPAPQRLARPTAQAESGERDARSSLNSPPLPPRGEGWGGGSLEDRGGGSMNDELSELGAETDARAKEALDSARAAIRGGATEVTIVSLERFDEMPVLRTSQGHEEFVEAKKEGVAFLPRRGPKRFLGGSRLTGIELRGVRAVFDANGRFAPQYDDDDVITIEADACVLAIGQKPDLSFLKPEDQVELAPAGTVMVDPSTLATSAPGVFAGGDVAFGPRNLIEAVANGKRAARSIHEHLAHGGARLARTLEIETLPTARYRMLAGFEAMDREPPPTLELGRRTGIAEVESGFDAAQAWRQAARCLVCHVQTIYDPEKCVLCNRCVDVCPEYCLAIVPFESLALPEEQARELRERAQANGLPLSAMVKDDERCIRCGLCAIRCPTDAMTMERFQITERYA